MVVLVGQGVRVMRLVLGALRGHRAQAAALFLLAVLAVAGASARP